MADIVHTRIAAARQRMLWTILIIIILILALIGGWPTWPYWGTAGAPYGYYPAGGISLFLLVLIILWVLGRL